MTERCWRRRFAAICIAAHAAGASPIRAGDPPGPSEAATAIAEGPLALTRAPAYLPDVNTLAAAGDTLTTERRWSIEGSLRPEEPGYPIHVSVAPYAWMTSQAGDLMLRGITVDADIRFIDLVDKSDSLVALMGAVDVECNRFVFQFNAEYARVQLKDSRGVFRNGTVSADVTETLGWYELLGGYRLLERPLGQEGSKRRLTVDGFVGGRITAIDLNTTLSASTTVTLPDGEVLTVGTTRERSGSWDWLEPFVGTRVGLDLSDHWSLSVRGDVGGFGIMGAKSAWSAAALLGYRWTMDGWTLAAFGGYRVLDQDYASGEFGWDVVTYGPLVGAQLSFSF